MAKKEAFLCVDSVRAFYKVVFDTPMYVQVSYNSKLHCIIR